jgi:HEAT repeat protein
MVTASYRNREYGHTGQGFSYLWGAPGAHVGGGEALATFFRHASWHFDLMRRCDGSFTYDGGEQYGPGRTDDDTYFGPSSYYGLSPDACAILTYALPLKTLVITGRDAAPAHALSADDVAAAEASGRLDLDRKAMSDDELIDRLGDWSPVARGWAAEELGRRPSRDSVVKTLINLAEGPDLHRAQGAAEALGHARSAAALPVLVRLLTAEDRWLRIKAAQALRQMGDLAKPVVPAMLRVIAETSVPTLPVRWDDPIQLAQGELAATVFQGSLQNVAHDADSALLHAAIRAVAQNPDGMARATLTRTIGEALSLDDIRALGPDLLEAIATPSPADTMFANEIRMASLKALARHRFREGIDAGLEFARTQSAHGSEHRTGEILALLLSYGRAAQPTLPALRALVGQFQAEDFPDWAKRQKIESLEKAIAILEAETDEPALRSFSE